MEYLKAFLCGGILCAIGQILIDKTKLTPARILVAYVVSGVVLGALGVYQYAAEWGGAGATVPLTGFGYSLAKGVQEAVAEDGLLGALTGGITATAGGITAAIFLGLLVALLFKPKPPAVFLSPLGVHRHKVFQNSHHAVHLLHAGQLVWPVEVARSRAQIGTGQTHVG